MTCAVVVATYNGENYIEEQLTSIIRQTRKPDYIIVTDDNSQDNTVTVCNMILSQSDIDYQIIINEQRQNVTSNFFSGVAKVTQDIIFFSDQDDIWRDCKIAKMMEIFEKCPDCAEVLCDAYIWSKKGIQKKTLINSFKKEYPIFNKDGLFDKDSFWYTAIKRNIATGMCMAVKKTVVMYRKKQKLLMYHDAWFNLVGAACGNVYVINEPLVFYRQHDSNVEGVKRKVTFYNIQKCMKKTAYSFEKRNERNKIISELNKQFHFLEKANQQYLERMIDFEAKREYCIINNKFCRMLILAIKYRQMYPEVIFIVRDLVVCGFGKKQ